MPLDKDQDEVFMRLALDEANAAAALDEVPVGCVIVVGGVVIARAGNRRESAADPTAHAEVLAIRAAATTVAGWRVTNATLYVTQEPCPMCAGAIINARIDRVVFGCTNPKAGAVKTLFSLLDSPALNHRATWTANVLAPECAAILTTFFTRLRTK